MFLQAYKVKSLLKIAFDANSLHPFIYLIFVARPNDVLVQASTVRSTGGI